MKRILALFLLVPFSLIAQRFSATVMDSRTGDNLEFVTVAIMDETSSRIIQSGVTTSDGKVLIDKIPLETKVVARFSFIGYETHTSAPFTLTGEHPNKRGGIILLKQSAQSLQAVEVEGEKQLIEYKLDKRIVNVSQSLVSDGGTATDVFQNVPGVTVDEDGNVSMKGSSGVTLLIDGKPAVLSGLGLDQISAASIESIELISNPSAKYNPEGMSGIINIKLKQSSRKVGVNGTVNASGGVALDKNNPLAGYNLNTNLNFGISKDFSIIFALGGNFRQRTSSGRSDTYTDLDTLIGWEHGEQNNTGGGYGGNARLGFDWKINKKNSLLFSVNGGLFSNQRSNNSPSATNSYQFIGNPTEYNPRYPDMSIADTALWLSSTYTDSKNKMLWANSNATVAYKWDGNKKDEEFTLDASFNYSFPSSNSVSDRARVTPPSDSNAYSQTSSVKGNGIDFDGQINYVYPINDKMKIEVGEQSKVRTNASYQKQNITQDLYGLQDSILDFTYLEQNHGIYFNYMAQFGNFSMQAGLRYEIAAMNANTHSESHDTVFSYFYHRLYPALHLSYKISKEQEIQLSYSRRVNRPRPWDLNPFINYNDYPISINYGNPALKPEDVHSLELNYQVFFKKAGTISTTAYYRHTNDVIRRYIFEDEQGVQHNTSINYASSINFGFDLAYDVTLWQLWRVSLSGGFYRNLVNGGGDAYLNSEGYSYNVRWNNTLNLPLAFTVQISASYRGPEYWGQTQMDSRFDSDIAVRKSFMNRKFVVGLRLSDIFNTRQFNRFVTGNNFEQYSIRKSASSRALYLTFTWNINQAFRERQRKRSFNIEGTAEAGDNGDM
ncbi:MAG: TonB-dependent receptor family protein [Bacteroidales bacterium]|jgi:outer membrane receptor protein involved in Fe transport|nr:TonB-dependent receptor family protein [Bacteroidales bacterium]